MKVLSVGEVLWDVFPDREFLGGAPLNVCANLRRAGDEAVLLSAVGDDVRGHAVLDAMLSLDLSTEFMQVVTGTSTGTAVVGKDAKGETTFKIERPAAFDSFTLSQQDLEKIEQFAPDWLYMGTLLQADPRMEAMVREIAAKLPNARSFYDMNLRTGHWNLALVERLCEHATVLKMNDVEAETLANRTGMVVDTFNMERFCGEWAARFDIKLICVTLGAAGCLIYTEGKAQRFAGNKVQVADTVGAGDAFAAAFLHGYHLHWPLARCAAFANALGSLVASRPGATPVWRMEECEAIMRVC